MVTQYLTAAVVTALTAFAVAAHEPPNWRVGVRPDPPYNSQRTGATQPVRVDPLTATISGRVTSKDTGAPIRRAEIRATSDRGLTRLVTTDDDGLYQVRDLPEGNFTVHVSKTGFVPLYFGQRRPFDGRSTIRLSQGQRAGANIALPRAGAITGRVVDQTGEPVMGARVQVLRRRMVQGQRGLQTVGAVDITDDLGAFRIYALPPGDYYVAVIPRPVEAAGGQRIVQNAGGRGTLPIFYPGTTNRQEAQRITVDVSGETRADLQLVPARAWRVSGVVLTSSGSPSDGAMLRLLPRDADFGAAPMGSTLAPLQITADANPDGTFELPTVPTGAYILSVTQRAPVPMIRDPDAMRRELANFAAEFEAGSMAINVDGDVDGVTVTTSRGGTLGVEFVVDRGVTRSIPSGMRLTIRSSDSTEMGTVARAGDKFELNLTQPARLDVGGLPDEWMVKAILMDDEDVIDKSIQLLGRSAMARVVLTDRVTELNGTVGSVSGRVAPTETATVIAFSDDAKKWEYPSRFVRTIRTDEKGAFRILGLPPDETYRVIAVDYLEEGEETDPEFLARLQDRASRVPLAEGERRTVDLRVIQR